MFSEESKGNIGKKTVNVILQIIDNNRGIFQYIRTSICWVDPKHSGTIGNHRESRVEKSRVFFKCSFESLGNTRNYTYWLMVEIDFFPTHRCNNSQL